MRIDEFMANRDQYTVTDDSALVTAAKELAAKFRDAVKYYVECDCTESCEDTVGGGCECDSHHDECSLTAFETDGCCGSCCTNDNVLTRIGPALATVVRLAGT